MKKNRSSNLIKHFSLNKQKMGIQFATKPILLLVILSVFSMFCTACGSGDGELNVTITDGYCSTLITASAGETVASVLSRAEITLSEEDVLAPEAEATITEDGATITISRSAQVTVTDGVTSVEVTMNGATVADAIAEAGITLGEHDVVNRNPDAFLTDGMEIVVEHWYEVVLTVSGEEQNIITQAATVQELLAEQEITVTDDDLVSPDLDTAIDADGIAIEVQYVSTREVVEETVIPYETVYEDSDTLYEGETEVAQEGQDGLEETTYVVTYIDGVEESRVESETIVTQEAVDEIILVGTKEEEPSEQASESNTGTSTGSGTTSGSGTSSGSGTTSGSGTSSGSGTNSGTGTSSGSETNSGAGTSSGSGTNSGAGTSSGSGTDSGTGASSESEAESENVSDDGRKIVSKEAIYDCDGSGYGYYVIEYEDGTIEYEDFYDPDFW